MDNTIKILESHKHGFANKEKYIVTRGGTIYLRIVGNEPIYDLITATASEDDKSYVVCRDKIRLISSALKFGSSINTPPSYKEDTYGRQYIYVCTIDLSSENRNEDLKKVYAGLEQFFQIYDTCDPASHEVVTDMQDIYSILAHGNSNEDVYLSDGVWLSSDGKLHDRGR